MRPFLLATAVAALVAAPAGGQSLDARVGAVRDGTVQFTFPVRPGACDFNHDHTFCGRVVIHRQDGKTESLRLHSEEWRDSAAATTDIGRVPAADAARYLVAQARTLSGRSATDALFGASMVDSVDVHPDLRAIIGDSALDRHIRGDAIIALGGDDIEPTDVSFLERLYATQADSFGDRVLLVLAHADDASAQEWMLGVVADSTRSLRQRKQALFWVGQSDLPTARLTSAYERLTSPELKRHFAFVLSQRHDAASLDALMRIAQQDPDRQVRKQALFWIGQSRDPRAVHFLEELVTR